MIKILLLCNVKCIDVVQDDHFASITKYFTTDYINVRLPSGSNEDFCLDVLTVMPLDKTMTKYRVLSWKGLVY